LIAGRQSARIGTRNGSFVGRARVSRQQRQSSLPETSNNVIDRQDDFGSTGVLR
jgi:hypothetical protein